MRQVHLFFVTVFLISNHGFALDPATKQKFNNNLAKLDADMAKFRQNRLDEYVSADSLTSTKEAISKATTSCFAGDSAKQDTMDAKVCDEAIKNAQKSMMGLYGVANPKVTQATASASNLAMKIKPAGAKKSLLDTLKENRDKLVSSQWRNYQTAGDIETLNDQVNTAVENCLDANAERIKKMTQLDQTRCTKSLEIAQKAVVALEAKWRKAAPKK